MGSIYHIKHNPKDWRIIKSELKLKEEYGGEQVVEAVYGELDDYPSIYDLSMYFRSSIYDKLISGEYKVDTNSRFGGNLRIIDSLGNKIEPLSDGFCY